MGPLRWRVTHARSALHRALAAYNAVALHANLDEPDARAALVDALDFRSCAEDLERAARELVRALGESP